MVAGREVGRGRKEAEAERKERKERATSFAVLRRLEGLSHGGEKEGPSWSGSGGVTPLCTCVRPLSDGVRHGATGAAKADSDARPRKKIIHTRLARTTPRSDGAGLSHGIATTHLHRPLFRFPTAPPPLSRPCRPRQEGGAARLSQLKNSEWPFPPGLAVEDSRGGGSAS